MRAVVWVLFVVVMYLILTEAVWRWVKLPGLGDVGFTVAFVLFALLHCAAIEGWKRTGIFFAISAVVSYAMEEVGVRTGMVYGAYHYSDMLGAKLGHVPVLIPLAWFMMIYPSWMVARALLSGMETRKVGGITALAAVAAIVMTAWDVVMDPGMARAGNWVWEHGGVYFGVPRRNYLGWLATTFLVYWIVGWMWRRVKVSREVTRVFEALPVVVYAFFAWRYVLQNRILELELIALFAMGLPGLVAVVRVFGEREVVSSEGL